MTRDVHVTDHAVLRYLERVWGVDTDALRQRIAAQVETGVALGAGAVIADGARFALVGDRVVTVTSAQQGKMTNRARRMRKRLK